MMLFTESDGCSRYRADLSMVYKGGEWKYRLVHKGWGGRMPAKTEHNDYVSQENALKAFVRLYGE